VWDTQWDMQLALIGSIVSLVALSWLQDRQLAARGVPLDPIDRGVRD